MLIILCTFLATFVSHRAQNVLQTQHFVLWLLFPRILHLRKICISRKIANELLHVNRNLEENLAPDPQQKEHPFSHLMILIIMGLIFEHYMHALQKKTL